MSFVFENEKTPDRLSELLAMLKASGWKPELGPWQAPALLNGWSDFGSGYVSAGYAIDSVGIVHLRGLIKSGTVGATAFQLPPGFRPVGHCIFPAVTYPDAFARVTVNTTGNVSVTTGSPTWLSLAGITFEAYQ